MPTTKSPTEYTCAECSAPGNIEVSVAEGDALVVTFGLCSNCAFGLSRDLHRHVEKHWSGATTTVTTVEAPDAAP